MTNDPTSAAYEALKTEVLEHLYALYGVDKNGRLFTHEEGDQYDKAANGIMQLFEQAIAEAETRGRSNIDLPPQVIRHLGKYLSTGVSLSTYEEVFNGERIYRWIANGTTVIWTESLEANADGAKGRAGEDKNG